MDAKITITKPYRSKIEDVPAQVIIASLPQMAVPLTRNTYSQALSRAKLRHAPKRLRFVEAKLTLNGYRLTIKPKGPLVHLLDRGVQPHSLAPLRPRPGSKRTAWPMHPGFPGRLFMPAALTASLPEMQRILDRNTGTYLAKVESK
jgi:hypothetical protein